MRVLSSLGVLQGFTVAVAIASSVRQGCTEVEIPVTVDATPVPFPEQINLSTISNYLALNFGYLLTLASRGTYTIRGTHCKSSVESAEANGRLQVLVHGILGSRHYWSGLDPPSLGMEPFHGSNYSYVDYALSKGYDTLAVDRLGNGRSDHPNPLAIHLPAQLEAMNAFLTEIKAGALGTTPRDLIWVGHSWGSILGSVLVAKYPNAVERLVLTGWSAFVSKSSLTAFRSLLPWPAKLANPERFSHLPLAYLHPTNKVGSERLNFWQGEAIRGAYYGPAVQQRIQSVLGTVSLTELLSPGLFNGLPAPYFRGQVLVVTGKYDEFFCAQSYLPGHADCGIGGSDGKGGQWGDLVDDQTYLGKTKAKVFPNAKRFDYYVPPNTGHGITVHYSQFQSFDATTAWLKETVGSVGATPADQKASGQNAHDEL